MVTDPVEGLNEQTVKNVLAGHDCCFVLDLRDLKGTRELNAFLRSLLKDVQILQIPIIHVHRSQVASLSNSLTESQMSQAVNSF